MLFIFVVSCCNIIVSDVDFPVINNFNRKHISNKNFIKCQLLESFYR